jgi:4-amino-4-deoxy-L-arabinose transferase-like glycosyltransferase
MDFSKVVDKTVDGIFGMKKRTIFLILIFVLAFVLRFIAAINLGVSADDMHHTLHAVNFLKEERLVTYDQSSGLWHSFTDIMYRIFGTTQLASRLSALIFGSLSIFLIYLISREFFNEKTSLLAAFILAIAPFHIKHTIAEMDVMAMFFVLFGIYLFLRAMKTNNSGTFAIAGIGIGLAIYTKVYPLLFIPSILLYFIYYNRKLNKKIFSKENIKKILIFLIFIFIFTIPVLTHNYLLYQDKGFLDLQFTRTLGLGRDISAQYYAWDFQFTAKNDWKGMIFGNSRFRDGEGPPLIWETVRAVTKGDPVSVIFGVIGAVSILAFSRKYAPYVILFFLLILLAHPFLASIVPGLSKHFIFFEIFLIPLAAFSVSEIDKRTASLLKSKTTGIILTILFAFSIFVLGQSNGVTHTFGKSDIALMMDFKEDKIPENALIVGDSRIYQGRIHWAFHGRPYLSGSEFIQILGQQEQIPGVPIQMDIYYFECISDDCGWGTVKNQPEFNASMEMLTGSFKESGQLVETITEPIKEETYYPILSSENRRDSINIYKLPAQMKPEVLMLASQPKEWFLYTIGFAPKEKQFDFYQTTTFLPTLLDKIAHWIVKLAVILTFISPFYLFYKLKKK